MKFIRLEFTSYEELYDFEFIAPDDITEDKVIDDLSDAIVKSINWRYIKRWFQEEDESDVKILPNLVDCIDFKNMNVEMEKKGYTPIKYDIIVYAGAWSYFDPKNSSIIDFHETGELTKLEKAIQEKLRRLKTNIY